MADELSQEGGSKTKLLNDMVSLLQKVSAEYDRIDAKSKSIASNLKTANGNIAGGGSSSQVAAGGGTFSGGFANYMQGQGGVLGFLKNVGSTVLGTASAAASALPSVQQAVSSQLLTSQAKFSGMQGNVNSTVQSLMGMGTTSSSTDVQQAIAQGTASGVLPGLPGYNSQIMPGVMQLSNLTGSAQSAMQATASLNSASSVNTLRMMGINVRGANGAERNPAAIFKDIWNFAVSQSGGKLNASNIAIALQPGNGLANLLDAAAAGDQTLRQALQTAALQYSKGGDLSRTSTTATGQTTSALNSSSNLNQAQFGLLAASQDPMAKGYTEANNLLAGYTKEIAGYVKQNQGLVTQLAKGETLIGSQIGQAATGIITTLIAGFGALGAGKGLLGAAKGGGSLLSKAGSFLKRNAKKILTVGEVAVEEAGAAAAEVGTLGTVGTAVEIGVNALVAKQVADAFSQHKGSSAGTGLGQGTTVNPQVSSPSSSSAANAVLSTGASLIGVPYSWGGGSIGGPTKGTQQGSGTVGFDCSSFVQYAFARVGVMLPRTTYAQVNCGIAIDPLQAQPGDLLFFGNPQAPHHVAIYMGNGRIIQAPQTGQVISTAGVNLRSVAACRRVLSGKTGTALNGNTLHMPHRSVTSLPGGAGAGAGFFSGLVGHSMSAGSNGSIDMNSLLGYDPTSAMGGGSVGGSGLGQGAEMSSYAYSSTNMAQNYLSINSKTGTIETSSHPGGTTVHYGGVTIPITVPQGSQIDAKELASMIKKELVSINIHAKVATS